MDAVVVQDEVLASDATEVAVDLRRMLHRLWIGAMWCVESHSGRMNADPEYRATVERKMKRLSARPGLLGETVRFVVAATHGRCTCCDVQAGDAQR